MSGAGDQSRQHRTSSIEDELLDEEYLEALIAAGRESIDPDDARAIQEAQAALDAEEQMLLDLADDEGPPQPALPAAPSTAAAGAGAAAATPMMPMATLSPMPVASPIAAAPPPSAAALAAAAAPRVYVASTPAAVATPGITTAAMAPLSATPMMIMATPAPAPAPAAVAVDPIITSADGAITFMTPLDVIRARTEATRARTAEIRARTAALVAQMEREEQERRAMRQQQEAALGAASGAAVAAAEAKEPEEDDEEDEEEGEGDEVEAEAEADGDAEPGEDEEEEAVAAEAGEGEGEEEEAADAAVPLPPPTKAVGYYITSDIPVDPDTSTPYLGLIAGEEEETRQRFVAEDIPPSEAVRDLCAGCSPLSYYLQMRGFPIAPGSLQGLSSVSSGNNSSGEVHLTVSSARAGSSIPELLDGNLETYWQSDGQAPHLLTVSFYKRQSIAEVCLHMNYQQDESYTPLEITFKGGSLLSDLQELRTITLNEPTGWVRVPFVNPDKRGLKRYLRVFVLQIVIAANHQSGRDCHIRQLKIFSPTTAPAPPPLSMPLPSSSSSSSAGVGGAMDDDDADFMVAELMKMADNDDAAAGGGAGGARPSGGGEGEEAGADIFGGLR